MTYLNRLRQAVLILVSAIAFTALLGSLCWYSIKRTQNRAAQFLESTLKLNIGRSSADEVLRVVDASGGRIDGFEPCRALKSCTGVVVFETHWLSRLGLAPQVGFAVRFRIDGDRLRSRYAAFSISDDSSERQAYVDESEPEAGKKDFAIVGYTKPYSLGVLMTSEAPDDLRTLAYKFDFGCMSRLHGCRTFEEFLPILERKDLVGPNPWMRSQGN